MRNAEVLPSIRSKRGLHLNCELSPQALQTRLQDMGQGPLSLPQPRSLALSLRAWLLPGPRLATALDMLPSMPGQQPPTFPHSTAASQYSLVVRPGPLRYLGIKVAVEARVRDQGLAHNTPR